MRSLALLQMMTLGLPQIPEGYPVLELPPPDPAPDGPVEDSGPKPRNRHERRAQAARARKA